MKKFVVLVVGSVEPDEQALLKSGSFLGCGPVELERREAPASIVSSGQALTAALDEVLLDVDVQAVALVFDDTAIDDPIRYQSIAQRPTGVWRSRDGDIMMQALHSWPERRSIWAFFVDRVTGEHCPR